MSNLRTTIIVFALIATSLFTPAMAGVNIIPMPQSVVNQEGSEFVFTKETRLITHNAEQLNAAKELTKRLRRSAEISLVQSSKCNKRKNRIEYQYLTTLAPEAYTLDITAQAILIAASDAAGYYYATQTLLQLLPTAIFNEKENNGIVWSVPSLTITDAPRYAYRGFMLDVSRYFLPKQHVLRLLDLLSIHKINKFHWHLVDDNGWRIEIKKYPLLTSVGAYRVERQQMFPMRNNPMQGEPTPTGGYYTQDDVREIVAYAATKQIEVIPEIEMPAHTNSSLAAYPHLTCPVVDREKLGTIPGIGGGNAANIYCAGNDAVFTFLQDVIDEIVPLFPSKYIHIGGDEANKTVWKKCPLCQKRMLDNNIPNEEELQSYFIRRMNTYIQAKGKKIYGWDELVDSEIPEGTTIFGWRGNGDAAVKAAQKGHNIVLTPARYFYFIRYQGPQWFEPYTYFGNNTLADVYNYDVAMSNLPAELSDKVSGVQASMWTEFVYSWENLQYMIFPRLAAFADNAWSEQPKNWNNFVSRLDHLTQIYDNLGVTYATSMFNLFHTVRGKEGKLEATLSCIRKDVAIHYTVDNTEPTLQSPQYSAPILFLKGEKLVAATFLNGKRVGALLHLNTLAHKAVGCAITGYGGEGYRLTNALLGSERITDDEYVDCYDKDLNFVLDLGSETAVSKIVVHLMLNSGMGVVRPAMIRVEASRDNLTYENLQTIEYREQERFPELMRKSEINFANFVPLTTRYLRFTINKAGIAPQGNPREGQPTRFALDEIEVY